MAWLCTEPLQSGGPRFFGFAEYLAGLALIVVLWTIVEPRYRFRLQVAPLDLRRAAFYVIGAVGLLTLLTDLWRAQQWPVISGALITPAIWQALLAAALLLTFVGWMAIAFLWPPRFGRLNSLRYVAITERTILVGNPEALVNLAEAVEESANRVVVNAARPMPPNPAQTNVALNARRLLHVLEDPQFCRAAVRSAPGTIYQLYSALDANTRAASSMGMLTTNILTAAVSVEGSFLHRENADWQAGHAARTQRITRRVFGDCDLLDKMDGVFQNFYAHQWRPEEAKAYMRAAGIAFASYATREHPTHSITVNQIFSTVGRVTHTLRLVNGSEGTAPQSEIAREVIQFIEEAVDALGAGGISVEQWNSLDDHHNPIQLIAEIGCKLLHAASGVTRPTWTSWSVQHNLIWSGLFHMHSSRGTAILREVQARIASMLWIQILKLESFPNYVGTALLGLCLNITGLKGNIRRKGAFGCRSEQALLWLTRRWVIANFDFLYRYYPDMAIVGFSPSLAYRPKQRILRKTYEPHAGRPKPEFEDLQVASASNSARADGEAYSRFPATWGRRRLSTVFPSFL